MSDLEGKVAVVTGGSRGIGRAIASCLGHAGCSLAICSRGENAASTAAELAGQGFEVMSSVADVSRPEQSRNVVAAVLERYGRIDILVNNAAVNHSGAVATMSEERFDEIFATNVRGVFFAIQAVLPGMLARRSGRIVNVASFVARSPTPLYTAYAASKAAVLCLTRGLALELAEHDINVNAVCPGNVWSDMWSSSTAELAAITGKSAEQFFAETIARQPLSRPQTGEDIGNAVVYLCSQASKNMTGEAIYVSGGL